MAKTTQSTNRAACLGIVGATTFLTSPTSRYPVPMLWFLTAKLCCDFLESVRSSDESVQVRSQQKGHKRFTIRNLFSVHKDHEILQKCIYPLRLLEFEVRFPSQWLRWPKSNGEAKILHATETDPDDSGAISAHGNACNNNKRRGFHGNWEKCHYLECIIVEGRVLTRI